MKPEVLFQCAGVRFESAGGAYVVPPLHGVESISSVGGQKPLDAGQPDTGQLGDGLLDEVGVGSKPKDFHPLLDLRTGMVVTVVGDAFQIVG